MKTAPHITEVNPNEVAFRTALGPAGPILRGTPLAVYSRHQHYPVLPGEVLFEELIAPGELALYPMQEHEAARRGLPSCWGIKADGTVVVLRYASKALHKNSGIDVTSPAFLAQLNEIGTAFAAAGINECLELNIAGHLFPHGNGMVTLEVTDEANRQQTVTVIPMPSHVLGGDWEAAACFGFGPDGEEAFVMGLCAASTAAGGGLIVHDKDHDPNKSKDDDKKGNGNGKEKDK